MITVTVGGEKIPWNEGMTVADVIAKLPGGSFYAVVRVNGKLVSRPNFDKITVCDHSKIVPLPMVAGG